MRIQIRAVLGACAVALLVQVSTAPAVSSAPRAGVVDMLQGMDRSVRPGDDFFAYANGAWLAGVQIPPDRSRYGVSAELAEATDQRVAQLLRAPRSSQDPDAVKAAAYFAAFIDEKQIEARGLTGLKGELDRIAAIVDRRQLAHYLGSTLRADVDILNATKLYTDRLLGLWVAQDLDDPSRYSPFLLQGGLGMPDRDYYLVDSTSMKELRTQYQRHIAAMLSLAGTSGAEADSEAAVIYTLEQRIARVHSSRADSEDVKRGNNHWKRADFTVRAPGLDWSEYFAGAGLGSEQEFVVWQPGAVTGISALVASEPLDTWKEYLRARALEHFAVFLPQRFVDEHFAFYQKALQGTQQLQPRWKRAVAVTNSALGDAVGKLYAERYFPPAAKARIEELVRDLLASFAERIDKLAWMAPETRREAKAKLAALKVGVGYPDHWRDYAGLKIERDDALGNAARAELFEYQRSLAKLRKPVDRSEWVMVPQEVNAVNLPAMNALNFPAAILQPPFFDPRQPAARNYGAIGAVIGHEISHSFDDQGALFDAEGRLRNWWTADDYTHFRAAAEQLVKQYDAYRPFADLAVNGQQTLSENIADLAGLAVAYSAYSKQAERHGAPTVEGFSGDQQFFLGFAQSWRSKEREPALRQQIITDGHAPGAFRAATVRNIDAWYAAFDVKPGQKLYLSPAERVRMW
jgi:predicted metalloendopeptidase